MRPHDMPGSEEIFVPADQYHHLTVKNVRSRNTQPKTWKANTMTAAVTVYTQPSCVQCDMTKRLLERMRVEHTTVDVSTDPDAHAYVTGLGYTAAPVVVVDGGGDHWAGFKPDRLRGLVG
jgi:glutaredoxin-like protein NrdH